MILHDYLPSGNGYKIRLLLQKLQQPFEWIGYDIVEGATETPEFLALNPNAKIPVLQLDDGRVLTESNAILLYLARHSGYLPEDPWLQAQVHQWLFFEQYSHEPNIATLRHWLQHLGLDEERELLVPGKRAAGQRALQVMERHLTGCRFLVGERFSVADIALYAYTHVAEEGGFALVDYPEINAWLSRVASLPGHVSIDWQP